MKKYRICWRAIKANATGHGTGAFPKDQAEQIASALNEENRGVTYHWIEEIKSKVVAQS